MFEFGNVTLDRFIIHQVGSSFDPTSLLLSESELVIHDPDLKQVLLSYFLSSFKPGAFYQFDIEDNPENHIMNQYTSSIFENPSNFKQDSDNIAKWLHNTSQHPNIKTGELYIGLFKNCSIDGQECDCLGIFKSENKDIFLKVFQNDQQIMAEYDEGVSIRKLDKGCLIFNIHGEKGYKITIVDKVNKGQEAQYWRTDFLSLLQISDNYYQTEQVMQVCKQFGNEVLTDKNSVEKAEQIAFLQRSQDYFKNSERFDNDEFSKKVIGNDEAIEAFEEYKKQFTENYGVEFADNFSMSKPAVSKGKKYFRPAIKLDRNFHVYVHGNPDFIERGFDSTKQMNYYKLFFNEES
ncbi:MAG: nucleoid-associated protein [Salinivirgaceae bacterium]|nr:nucleoid-associated protein [Salinivirgaceae bacterium]